MKFEDTYAGKTLNQMMVETDAAIIAEARIERKQSVTIAIALQKYRNTHRVLFYTSEYGDDDGLDCVKFIVETQRPSRQVTQITTIDIPMSRFKEMRVSETALICHDEDDKTIGMSVALLRLADGTTTIAYYAAEYGDGHGSRMCADFVREVKPTLRPGEAIRRISISVPFSYVEAAGVRLKTAA